jgi:NAD(P)-dependent dehydrogenase (short-subunit alcohol dehydrogenase family)
MATEAGDGHVDILVSNAGVAVLGPSDAAAEVNQLAALAPAGRVAEPEEPGEPGELASAIVFLAGEAASFIHGVTVPVDGGRAST